MWLIRRSITYYCNDRAACSNRIEKKLNKLDDVNAQVNLTTEKATVEYNLINMMSKNLLIGSTFRLGSCQDNQSLAGMTCAASPTI